MRNASLDPASVRLRDFGFGSLELTFDDFTTPRVALAAIVVFVARGPGRPGSDPDPRASS